MAVTVTMDGGYGKAAAVRIRGEEGYRTRIVLDGINIADPSSPQISPRVEHLLSSGLSRVEILRGLKASCGEPTQVASSDVHH